MLKSDSSEIQVYDYIKKIIVHKILQRTYSCKWQMNKRKN